MTFMHMPTHKPRDICHCWSGPANPLLLIVEPGSIHTFFRTESARLDRRIIVIYLSRFIAVITTKLCDKYRYGDKQ